MIKRILLFGNPAKLRLENKQLKIILKKEPPEEKTVPIEDIGYVIIDHPQITITSGAIGEMMKNNVAIISCDQNYMPTALMLPFEGHHVQTQRMRAQIEASAPLKKNLWMQTVKAKILNQANLMERLGICDHPLRKYAKDVKSGDTTNREAAAANHYWNVLFPSIPNFFRDPMGPYPNNFLNYAYAILRSVMARAIVGAGLFPSFGLFHKNKYNAFCLADDLMEPYRPFADLLVINTMKKFPEQEVINTDIKKELLMLPHMDVFIAGHKSPLMIAAQHTAASLVQCFEGKKKKMLYPVLQ